MHGEPKEIYVEVLMETPSGSDVVVVGGRNEKLSYNTILFCVLIFECHGQKNLKCIPDVSSRQFTPIDRPSTTILSPVSSACLRQNLADGQKSSFPESRI